MLGRVAPPFSTRRLALRLLASGVRDPRALRARVNLHNLREWGRYRRTEATCNICGHVGTLRYDLPDLATFARHHIRPLRETLRCRGCHAKMRDRVLAAGLLDVLRDRGIDAETVDELVGRIPADLRILDTDAHSRIARRLQAHPGLVRSLYLPGKENGERLDDDRMLNVDLERMPFPDRHFDVVITSEVMEHVRHVDTAHREIARCLEDDGVYLFTVPYDAELTETWVLIDPETDEELVSPPHVHGDPMIREAGIKAYRVFGRDLVGDLERTGLRASFAPVHRPELGIFEGDLFVATRAVAHAR
ncbi:methyltransferase domain-containing protein [Nocardioides sp.]|uniref:class I SAM-dependent methyltransferase n=1 Tax=Nocardioides sp. TaxID=35761 RepID=UPI001A23DB62|nr:methyltransferase domain-containing protein [Nocardioides sp.]MBJ7357707.1 methyltransferase domain-containing protein [Nocardioides sp.]